MKKILYAIILLNFVFSAKAQQTQKGLLWEISGKDLQKPSYIFGTLHIICPDKFFVPAHTKESFEATSQLFLEIDMDDPSMMMKAQKLMFSADGKKLKDLMQEADYKLFSEYFKKTAGMDVAMFGSAKPLLYMSLAMAKSAGCPAPKSYEEYFMSEAKTAQREVLGLETLEDQIGMMDKSPMKQQLDWLLDLVKESEKGNETYDQMLVLYKDQDTEMLTKMIAEKMVGMKGLEEEMLDNRNQRWIPIIEKNIKEKSTFFAVGAGHLGGEKGVLALLRKQGYKVSHVE